jgi:predicted esterase
VFKLVIQALKYFPTEIPYFQAHGESDNILPLSYGINTSKKLKQFLPNHEVSLERKKNKSRN